ncbi:hypothetical protein D3C80_2140540 [compost metagenome]
MIVVPFVPVPTVIMFMMIVMMTVIGMTMIGYRTIGMEYAAIGQVGMIVVMFIDSKRSDRSAAEKSRIFGT